LHPTSHFFSFQIKSSLLFHASSYTFSPSGSPFYTVCRKHELWFFSTNSLTTFSWYPSISHWKPPLFWYQEMVQLSVGMTWNEEVKEEIIEHA
jgi:hypothetical protein